MANEATGKDTSTEGNHFAVTDILNKNYYIELSDYMSTSSKSAQQFAEDPLTELVFRTFFREFMNYTNSIKMIGGKYVDDPALEKKWSYVINNCSRSMIRFTVVNSVRRKRGAASAEKSAKGYRRFWDKFLSNNSTPDIFNESAPLAKPMNKPEKSSPNNINIDHSHSRCLNAKDYEGCMKFQSGTGGATNTASAKKCKPYEWCIASSGIDAHGKQKIEGWMMLYKPSDKTVIYRRPNPQKVNVRGKTDRYFAIEKILRIDYKPIAGSGPSTFTFGQSQTNCTAGYLNTVNCATRPATTITNPGYAGDPGGVRDTSAIHIYDCIDNTVGLHLDGRLQGKWKKSQFGAQWSSG